LFVISRNSSFTYRASAVDVRKVSKELGVRYILEGSVRKAGNRVRVSAQLIDGTAGSHVWAEKYDGELQDIFDLQDQITQQVVAALLTQIHINVSENAKPLERPDIGTWDLLNRGLKLYYKMTKESLTEAETIFRKAVSFAPSSCDAHHWLSSVLFHHVWMGHATDNDAAISEAYNLAKTAISLDEYNEYAHWNLGLLQFLRGKRDVAIEELKRAVDLNPNCSVAHSSLGTVLGFSGESDESIRNNEIAIRSNPKDPSIFFRYSGIAMAHFVAGRYQEASQWARKSINRKPNWRIGHAVLASSLAQLNLLEEAKEAVNNFLENVPDETINDLRKVLPFKKPDDAQRFEEGLRNAGMPE
jgi:tetratricopeptide (TPR) repeat protein